MNKSKYLDEVEVGILGCEGYVQLLHGVRLELGVGADEGDEVVGDVVRDEVAAD